MTTSPTDILRAEHRVILGALTALERAAQRLAAAEALPEGWWDEALEWLRAFADRNHHAKEEKSLFPALVKAGVPSEGGPVGVMLAEHVEGRALIRGMAADDPAKRVAAARRYVRLLRDHIAKEDGVLWPLAESVLDEQAVAAVGREFAAVEVELGREASIEYQEGVMTRLASAIA